jgi:hypothetical protein
MIDEAPDSELEETEGDDERDPESLEFYVPNPEAVTAALDHVHHWADDRSIQALIGTHTLRHLRVLLSHAEQSLAAMRYHPE